MPDDQGINATPQVPGDTVDHGGSAVTKERADIRRRTFDETHPTFRVNSPRKAKEEQLVKDIGCHKNEEEGFETVPAGEEKNDEPALQEGFQNGRDADQVITEVTF